MKDESKGQQQAEFSREKGKNGGGWNLELGAWGLGLGAVYHALIRLLSYHYHCELNLTQTAYRKWCILPGTDFHNDAGA